jgi:hypothetical protein
MEGRGGPFKFRRPGAITAIVRMRRRDTAGSVSVKQEKRQKASSGDPKNPPHEAGRGLQFPGQQSQDRP